MTSVEQAASLDFDQIMARTDALDVSPAEAALKAGYASQHEFEWESKLMKHWQAVKSIVAKTLGITPEQLLALKERHPTLGSAIITELATWHTATSLNPDGGFPLGRITALVEQYHGMPTASGYLRSSGFINVLEALLAFRRYLNQPSITMDETALSEFIIANKEGDDVSLAIHVYEFLDAILMPLGMNGYNYLALGPNPHVVHAQNVVQYFNTEHDWTSRQGWLAREGLSDPEKNHQFWAYFTLTQPFELPHYEDYWTHLGNISQDAIALDQPAVLHKHTKPFTYHGLSVEELVQLVGQSPHALQAMAPQFATHFQEPCTDHAGPLYTQLLHEQFDTNPYHQMLHFLHEGINQYFHYMTTELVFKVLEQYTKNESLTAVRLCE